MLRHVKLIRVLTYNVAGDKVTKVKNFSKDPIPAEIEAFCSLGPKACPVELDVNTARLDKK